MAAPLSAAFPYQGYSISAKSDAPMSRFVLTISDDTPLLILLNLLGAATTWCATRKNCRASIGGNHVFIDVPVAIDLRGFPDFIDAFQELLLDSPKPLMASQYVTRGGATVHLICQGPTLAEGYEKVRVMTANSEIQDSLFLAASAWCKIALENKTTLPLGPNCIRDNGVITIMALPQTSFTPAIFDALGIFLRAAPLAKGAAAGASMPGNEQERPTHIDPPQTGDEGEEPGTPEPAVA